MSELNAGHWLYMNEKSEVKQGDAKTKTLATTEVPTIFSYIFINRLKLVKRTNIIFHLLGFIPINSFFYMKELGGGIYQ